MIKSASESHNLWLLNKPKNAINGQEIDKLISSTFPLHMISIYNVLADPANVSLLKSPVDVANETMYQEI